MDRAVGQRSALIVASYDYQDPGLRRLRAPAVDAEALARVLRDPQIGGFDVRTMLNEPAHVISEAVEEFFVDRSRDDLLLVHFSCHGVKDEGGELYFAASNTRLRLLGATAVAADFVNRRMNRSRSRRIVLLLDCCYAGAFERGITARAGSSMDIEERFDGRGRAVITASSAMEYAFEGDQLAESRELQPSVFTSALVEGLETGEADRDQDGYIGLDELYDYVYDAVREVTPNQTPGKWAFGVQGDLHIARRSHPVTKPAPLPPELQQAVDARLAGIRAGAVHELERLLSTEHGGLALAAKLALERLAQDDSRMVAAAAAAALSSHVEPTAVEPVTPKRELPPSASNSGPLAQPEPEPTHPPTEPPAVTEARWWWRSPKHLGIVAGAATAVLAAAAILLVRPFGIGQDATPTAIPAGFAGTWVGPTYIPSEGVNVMWRVTFVAGGRIATMIGTATSCAGGNLTWTGGTNSVMNMRYTPPPNCTPGNVTVTPQGQNRLRLKVDPDGSVEPSYEGLLHRQ